jgi:hypothetical protein
LLRRESQLEALVPAQVLEAVGIPLSGERAASGSVKRETEATFRFHRSICNGFVAVCEMLFESSSICTIHVAAHGVAFDACDDEVVGRA